MNGQQTIPSLKPETLTWAQGQSMFALRSRAGGHSVNTADGYQWTLSIAAPFFCDLGAERPASVSPVHVKQFLDHLRKRGLSSSTIETRYRHLRTFFRSLVADGLLDKDPTDRVAKPRIESRRPSSFSPDDFTALLRQINAGTTLGKRDVALICMLYDSGARVSEVLSLKISDLDIAHGQATIRGKGGKFRPIAWGDKTRRATLDWLRCRPDALPGAPLFCDQYGGPLSRNAVRIRLKRLTRKAGIASVRLGAHALRHGCALSLLRGGADLETVRRVLGHSRLTTTQIYLQGLSDEEALAKARAVGVVDRLGNLPNQRRVRLR
jgi:site-specific recombinase XerD